jgi:hypothetical protein
LTSVEKRELDIVEILALPLLFGICFWVILSYFVSDFRILHWITVCGISFASSIVADTQNIHLKSINLHEITLLLVCCLFMVSYSYPWSQFFEWVPPGDDMKFHATHIESIYNTSSLPTTYGPLYPEVDTLSYPLGYHIIVSLGVVSSGISFSSIIISTLFLLPLSCFSFYFLGKTLFDQKTGLYSAFSVSFLSLFFHRLSFTSTYPNLLAIILQIFAFSLLFRAFREKSNRLIILCALAFAASGATHSYIFLLNVIFLSFLAFFFLLQRNFSKMGSLLSIGVVFLLLSIPCLLRLQFQPLSAVEMRTFTVWYTEDSITSLSDLAGIVSVLSPLLLFGVFGGISLRKQKTAFISWLSAILLIPVLSALEITYPGWYTMSPNRVFLYVFAPLCILSGKFLADLEIILTKEKFGTVIIILLLLSAGMHHADLFKSFSPDPVSEVQMNPDDAFAMNWIADHTTEDAIILNTGPTVDCSSWVPFICKRRVIFPSFSGHRGDNCIEKIGTHRKLVDLEIVRHVPDSELALQVLETYNIAYIYIPAWRKRVYLDLYPDRLLKSPLYQSMVKMGDAYVFRVNYDEQPETTCFPIVNLENVTIKGGRMSSFSIAPYCSSDVQGTFFLQVEYTDTTYGYVDIAEADEYLATIFAYQTGEEKSMIFPLSSKRIELQFSSDTDFSFDRISILFGTSRCIAVSRNVGMKGEWGKVESEPPSKWVTAPAEDSELRIYLFNVNEGELILTYEDVGYGNVDINVPTPWGTWHGIATIYRENSGELKEVRIPIDGEYSILVMGIYAYGEQFTMTFQYEGLS